MGRGEDALTWEMEEDELRSLEAMLKGMLTYEPSERITSGEAIESEWMVKWSRGGGPKPFMRTRFTK